MIQSILQSLIYFFVFWYRYFFHYKNYHIKDAFLTTSTDKVRVDIQDYNSFDYFEEDITVFIHYYFRNKEYIYVTHSKVFDWPPVRTQNGMIFNLPIKYAAVLNDDDVEQFNVTTHIQKYAGPYNDFHEETILFKDIESYYSKLKLINILDQVVVISDEDSINHQTLWLPNKILDPQD